MSPRQYVVAAVQLCAGSDKIANLDKAEAFAAEAVRYAARLLVLPEVFLWRGPRAEEHAAAEPIPGPSSNRLGELARRLKLHLLAGSILEQSGQRRVFNTSILFDSHGQIVARYRKIHLFDVDIPERVTIRESDTRMNGDTVVTAPTELGVIGMSVCYDLRFPELYRQLTLGGAEIIAVPSA
ncbi:MAG: nitrilase-related carbon-nitrogen hydrolase, partial [Gaiellaceae bacterium]